MAPGKAQTKEPRRCVDRNNAAGPVGGAVGTVVGGTAGPVTGGVQGALGVGQIPANAKKKTTN